MKLKFFEYLSTKVIVPVTRRMGDLYEFVVAVLTIQIIFQSKQIQIFSLTNHNDQKLEELQIFKYELV